MPTDPETIGVLSAWQQIRSGAAERHRCSLPPYWVGMDGKPYICPCGREYLLAKAPDIGPTAATWETDSSILPCPQCGAMDCECAAKALIALRERLSVAVSADTGVTDK